MKTNDSEKIEEILKKYYDCAADTYTELRKFIRQALASHGDYDFSVLETYKCVMYDGGAHPEYRSGYHEFTRLYLNPFGVPSLDLRYSEDDYEIDRLTAADLAVVAEAIVEADKLKN